MLYLDLIRCLTFHINQILLKFLSFFVYDLKKKRNYIKISYFFRIDWQIFYFCWIRMYWIWFLVIQPISLNFRLNYFNSFLINFINFSPKMMRLARIFHDFPKTYQITAFLHYYYYSFKYKTTDYLLLNVMGIMIIFRSIIAFKVKAVIIKPFKFEDLLWFSCVSHDHDFLFILSLK